MILKKKSIPVLPLCRWFQNSMKLDIYIKKIKLGVFYLFIAFCLVAVWEIYIPRSRVSNYTIKYVAQNGAGDEDIARDLEKLGIIKSNYFFRFFVVSSFQHGKLLAGKYLLSPNMSVYQIVKKMVLGDVIKQKITILPGWDLRDIKKYFIKKEICAENDFDLTIQQDFSDRFDFLAKKPKDAGLEGYFFPDTYEISEGQFLPEILKSVLNNFDQKITPEIREQIASENKTLFEIITVASLLEKEARPVEDKEIIAGIIYKRLKLGMPLQIDATINYITGKNDPGASLEDIAIDSPYNTYKYAGLPKGPISNPAMSSILAAISPKETKYLYYLGSGGRTIFSKTLAEHNAARAKYLTR